MAVPPLKFVLPGSRFQLDPPETGPFTKSGLVPDLLGQTCPRQL